MLRFFRPAARSPAHRLPPGLRVYAVGDVHGRADCLAALQRRATGSTPGDEPRAAATVLPG